MADRDNIVITKQGNKPYGSVHPSMSTSAVLSEKCVLNMWLCRHRQGFGHMGLRKEMKILEKLANFKMAVSLEPFDLF